MLLLCNRYLLVKMATEFGGFVQVADAENRPGLRRAKRMDANIPRQNVQNGGKRAALGNITNQSRVQPSRAAKNQVNFKISFGNFGGPVFTVGTPSWKFLVLLSKLHPHSRNIG